MKRRSEADPVVVVAIIAAVMLAILALSSIGGCAFEKAALTKGERGTNTHERHLTVTAAECRELMVEFNSEGGLDIDKSRRNDKQSVDVDPSGLMGPQ